MKTEGDTLFIKTSLFDVPRELWKSGFNAFKMENSTLLFTDYAKQRDNPDFVRDFNLSCARQPHLCLLNTATGDQAHVMKGFLDQMVFDETKETVSWEHEDDKYAFLASDDQFNADGVDFSDPAALLRRQRLMQEAIQKHQANSTANFDPLKLLRRTG